MRGGACANAARATTSARLPCSVTSRAPRRSRRLKRSNCTRSAWCVHRRGDRPCRRARGRGRSRPRARRGLRRDQLKVAWSGDACQCDNGSGHSMLIAIPTTASTSAAAGPAAAPTKTIASFCSSSGDVCYGIFNASGKVTLRITTAARYFGRYTLCVRLLPPLADAAHARRCGSYPVFVRAARPGDRRSGTPASFR